MELEASERSWIWIFGEVGRGFEHAEGKKVRVETIENGELPEGKLGKLSKQTKKGNNREFARGWFESVPHVPLVGVSFLI